MPKAIEVEQRLLSKIDFSGDCWEWTAARHRNGYGQFGIGYAKKLAHRVAYELLAGPIPKGLTLDHLCRNRGCVNPDHLEPVTHAENCRRALLGRRFSRKDFVPPERCPLGHKWEGKRETCRACERRTGPVADRTRLFAQGKCMKGHELTQGAKQRVCKICMRGYWKKYDAEKRLKRVA